MVVHPRQENSYYNPSSVYPDNAGYYHSAVDMAPSQSQSSDSGYSSGMASPMSPNRGYYRSSTGNNDYHNHPSTSYQQYSYPTSQSSSASTSQAHSGQTSRSSSRKQTSPPKPKPYICLVPGCGTPFTRPFDLSRHMKTTHRVGDRIDCPESWCGRSGMPEGRDKGGFSRLDHFYEHVKKVHRKEVVRDSRGLWVKSPGGRMCEVRWTHPSSN